MPIGIGHLHTLLQQKHKRTRGVGTAKQALAKPAPNDCYESGSVCHSMTAPGEKRTFIKVKRVFALKR